jgi:hypothetical protein
MTVKLAKAETRRVQLDLLPERLAEFDQLMAFCGLSARKDLFDNAMTLFEWAVQEIRDGKQIASYDKKTEHIEVIRLPVLDNAVRRSRNFRVIEPTPVQSSWNAADPAAAPSKLAALAVDR